MEEKRKAKPNVFFILIDDMGWDDIGYQSRDLRAMTPNLNRMAEDGVKVCLSVSTCERGMAVFENLPWRKHSFISSQEMRHA